MHFIVVVFSGVCQPALTTEIPRVPIMYEKSGVAHILKMQVPDNICAIH